MSSSSPSLLPRPYVAFDGRRKGLWSGQRLRRSNIVNESGYNTWLDYRLTPIDNHVDTPYYQIGNALLVDKFGKTSSTPIDLALKFSYCDPISGEVKHLWVWDTELRWTEIIAGVRGGVIPARYVYELGTDGTRYGPMNRQNFSHMIAEFYVSPESVLFKDGLRVITSPDDFEWKVMEVLCRRPGFDLDSHTENSLVAEVQNSFGLWHIDAHERASKLLKRFRALRARTL
ncbi:hypothetical protein F5880DRAFT_1619060 [Lentinula raphanica]|nr:hypothetical protein F5880DRAFT_1619060 [Lentinula raphanica]